MTKDAAGASPVDCQVRPAAGGRKSKAPADALQHLRDVVSQYRQMQSWRLRHECEDPEPGAERKETLHRIALALAMGEAERFLAGDKGPNVEFSGVPAGHSSNRPAGGTSAGTQG